MHHVLYHILLTITCVVTVYTKSHFSYCCDAFRCQFSSFSCMCVYVCMYIYIYIYIYVYSRQRVFENRVLRRVFGPERDEVTGEWRKLHN